MTKLAPKKWGLSDSSSIALAAFLGGISYLLSQDIDLRPNLAAILGLAFMDSLLLGGTCFAQISCYWPPHKRRVIVHEAGHLLVGKALLVFFSITYLLGRLLFVASLWCMQHTSWAALSVV